MYQIDKGVKNCQTGVKISGRTSITNIWKHASCWNSAGLPMIRGS